jgi:hypothetical protein
MLIAMLFNKFLFKEQEVIMIWLEIILIKIIVII